MLLLTEDIINEVEIKEEVLEEGTNSVKNYFIEGIFLQAEVKNKNGRYYPLDSVKSAVDRYNRDYISTGRSLGELGHPSDSSGAGVNLHLASHKIESLRQSGNNFVGRAKVLDTPMGRIAKTLISEGVKLGVSLRGFGSLTEKNGMKLVGNNFVLTTVDIVFDPSAPDAFIHGITENTERYFHEGVLLEEDYSYMKKRISAMTKSIPINEQALLKNFEKFINKIKSKY